MLVMRTDQSLFGTPRRQLQSVFYIFKSDILKAHEGDITKLVWLESDHIMISGGKDKSIKVWKMPNSWFDKEKIEKDERDAEVNLKTTKLV